MSRVYVLINVKNGMADRVARALQNHTGVMMVDVVERPPDIVMVVQASNPERLTRLVIEALVPIDHLIEGLQLLPSNDKTPAYITPLTYHQN